MTHQIVFILVRPQMGENIGAAARAMMNFGIGNLRLVAPRDGWPSEAAQTMSAGAFERMAVVQVYDTLKAALADCNMAYATTARPRDINKPVLSPRDAVNQTITAPSSGITRTAFVFGPERTGLENDEIACCHAIVTAPVSPDFPSLNLAQCAGLIAYEIASGGAELKTDKETATDPPAPLMDFENLFTRLERMLDEGAFFQSDDLRPVMVRNLRAMLLRGAWSTQEIRTFHGVMTALARLYENKN